MKIISKAAIILLGILGPFSLLAETITLKSGEFHEGDISKIHEGEVTIVAISGDKFVLPIADLDEASSAVVLGWAAVNPEKVDVYTKWDAQPIIKASVMPKVPEQFHDSDFKGMVSVDLVLDQGGRVISAKIKKTTHPELEGPTLEAAREWIFEPASIGGRAVKAKLRVPFKFQFTVPQPEEESGQG